MAEQELRQRVVQEGAEDVASKLDDVATAQERAAGKVDELGAASDDAAQKQQKLNTSTEDLTSLLSRIDPRLGALADTLFKSSKIVGDLASQQINLGKATEVATNFLKSNAGALKLLAAGGAAALGIYAIARAFQTMREEAEKATKKIEDQVAALNELKNQEREQRDTIEAIADGRKRLGVITAEQAAKAQEDAEAIRRELPQIEEGTVNQVVGLTAGLGLGREQLTQAAVAQQIGALELTPEMSGDQMVRAIERATQRSGDRIAAVIERERQEGNDLIREALAEIQSAGGSSEAIERFIDTLPSELTAGVNKEDLAKTISENLSVGASDVALGDIPRLLSNTIVDLLSGQGGEQAGLEARASGLRREGVSAATPELVRMADIIARRIEKAAERMERAPRNVTVNNPRVVVPGTKVRDSATGQDRLQQAAGRVAG
jgi:hypothetical protein